MLHGLKPLSTPVCLQAIRAFSLNTGSLARPIISVRTLKTAVAKENAAILAIKVRCRLSHP